MELNKKFGKIVKISAIAFVLLGVFVLTFATKIDINNPVTGCPKGTMNQTAKLTCCRAMNKLRRPFSQCCMYPGLVIWRWQFDLCTAKCDYDFAANGYAGASYRCCVFPCCLTYLKVLGPYPERDGVNPHGLAFSFSISVGNDTRWTPVINSSVFDSYNQFVQKPKNMTGVTDPNELENYHKFWDCFELIPNYLYEIIDSSYNQNYLRCPVFNSTLDRCDLTRQFVQDCFVNYYE